MDPLAGRQISKLSAGSAVQLAAQKASHTDIKTPGKILALITSQ